MRLAQRIFGRVLVPVMIIVHMKMIVLHRLVPVLVHVPLGEMEPETDRHEQRSREQTDRGPLAEDCE